MIFLISKELFVRCLEDLKESYRLAEEIEDLKLADNSVIRDGTYFNPLLDTMYDTIVEVCNCEKEHFIISWYLFHFDSPELDRSYTEECELNVELDEIEDFDMSSVRDIECNPEAIYDYLYDKYMKVTN